MSKDVCYTLKLSIIKHLHDSEMELDFNPQLFSKQDGFSLPFTLLRCGVSDEDMKVFRDKFQDKLE